jgi:hypothetical protein
VIAMRRFKTLATANAALMILCLAATSSEAGLFGRGRARAYSGGGSCAGGSCSTSAGYGYSFGYTPPATVAPAPVYYQAASPVVYQATPTTATYTTCPGGMSYRTAATPSPQCTICPTTASNTPPPRYEHPLLRVAPTDPRVSTVSRR